MLRSRNGWQLLIAPLLVLACNGTRTGNPAEPGELIKSTLARDESPMIGEDQRLALQSDNQAFAFELYRTLATQNGANLFLSPHSISLALAMTYAGASGETKAAMADALHFSLPDEALHPALNAVELALQGRADEAIGANEGNAGKGLRLSITNGLFVKRELRPLEPFLDTLAVNYDTGVHALDFENDPEGARGEINDWVDDRTEGRISELLAKGAINPFTSLALVNAIYFKATWLREFDKTQTRREAFHAPRGEVTTAMMHGSFQRQYAEGSGFAIAELPYLSPNVRMLIVLPDEGSFATIEAGLDADWLREARQSLSPHMVELTMPQFQFASQFELKDALTTLGMGIAFSDRADFSRMLAAPAQIGAVTHEAFVQVDEEGTEAAAATAVVVMTPVSAPAVPPPAELVLDRPFIFAIYDEPTGQILFLGRVMDPTAG